METRIRSETDLADGVAHLRAVEPAFERAIEAGAWPAMRLRARGFEGLLHVITGQQVSRAAGDAIWGRLDGAGATSPSALKALGVEELRALGLSRAKAVAAIGAADALDEGRLCFVRQSREPYESAYAELVALKGVGPWTAQVYHMFCEGRADVFPPGDLALQEAARMIFEQDERPTAKALDVQAEAWRPWRAVAARLMWAYYRVRKGREGAL